MPARSLVSWCDAKQPFSNKNFPKICANHLGKTVHHNLSVNVTLINNKG